ncbi:uncharacterized protein KNAG_0B05600 [Huiozyma naganishii CBS 8797]|uniref:Uncharacterized protein n=1 Tax=Huiozyma naganishii (strain ATCC MYA-139 / BCRC 22969 / CBS 8797 / KCTC 17520 / NBRC 10181 / NCYC 3082 / Yp74L-3) TaxID=1071383 RepID=J7RHI4_HUIN7|nr:hypothetical protein KNAG_0B05600 [Kazachstania naganishii CBS 8797]CCK68993.1 hypothetical protein KNAG_0B05600 [Kazachstania naganishii CBS 8797]
MNFVTFIEKATKAKRTVKARFVNLFTREEVETYELDIEHYVRPKGCTTCMGRPPMSCATLSEKVDAGLIACDEALVSYIHEQEEIRYAMVQEQDRQCSAAIKKAVEEAEYPQPKEGCMFSSEIPSAVTALFNAPFANRGAQSRATPTENQPPPSLDPRESQAPSQVPPQVPSTSEHSKLRFQRVVARARQAKAISHPIEAQKPAPRPTETTVHSVPSGRPLSIISPNSVANTHPQGLVPPQNNVRTAPNSTDLGVAIGNDEMCEEGLDDGARRKGRNGRIGWIDRVSKDNRNGYDYALNNFGDHDPDITPRFRTIDTHDLRRWRKFKDASRAEYTRAQATIKELKRASLEFRLRKIKGMKGTVKTRTTALYRKLFKHSPDPEEPALPTRPVDAPGCGDADGYSAAKLMFTRLLKLEEETWRKYKHSLHVSLWLDSLIAANIDGNDYRGHICDNIRTEVGNLTGLLQDKLALLGKYQEHNLTTMNNISRCLETGRQLRLTMEQAPDATSRRKAKGEYLLYKDRLMVKLHRVLDSLDMMDGRYASEVELFSRLVSEKKEVYRRLHGMDLRHGIPVRVQEKIAWLRCMEADKPSLGVRVNMKIGEVLDAFDIH